MYVCICAAVTESQVREAASAGVRTLAQLQATLGVATGCGCCREFAQQLLERVSGEAPPGYVTVSRLAVAA
ncbi:MAG: (2Fe-2S)-binding protein [Burkholderiaceae bacterium]|nr:(2Fe-2S)-binding protein [Burkholderiaceae bacterium]MCX7901809.1 (2Fe-2S)-binding protein [Burkholderiaceae bacterium]